MRTLTAIPRPTLTLRTISTLGLVCLIATFSLFVPGCKPQAPQPNTNNNDNRGPREEKGEVKSGTTDPKETKGAPYPAATPSDRIPNDEISPRPVPTGSPVGDMKPGNREFEIREATKPEPGRKYQHALFFRDYRELPNSIGSASSCCPEISPAENGQTIMMTGNTFMALTEDGGANFSNINPTTIFPQVDGGFCCDQVVVYVPRIDMFIWLLQYWTDSNGKNRIRLAAQTTPEVRNSNGTAWTYWDFVSDTFDSRSSLDYNDVAVGDSSLWWTTQNGTGRVVVRIPLSQIAAKGTINFQYTGGTEALWSHLTQNARDTVYWAGHVSNSELRVYSMRDGEGFYSWRSVTVNSWPNGTNTATCPDGTDFMTFESWKHYVFGNALQRESVWFAWLAAAGGGFPQPHVQMVRINPSSWTREEQVQIWNPTIAFQDAYLSTNNQGELGMAVAFGSGGFFPSNAVGVWGDFVVYYPRLSTRCVSRWGNYNHSRRATVNAAEWIGAGYTNEKNSSGSNIVIPHYIRFGR
ncbi:MAG TPA: hypothetical protein VIB00_17945 [Pyrinomonadaceae bacterium]|jgi:hypothetical protein